jgi:hypothetical protein
MNDFYEARKWMLIMVAVCVAVAVIGRFAP